MHHLVSQPFTFWFMIIGVVSATFHFANGMWSFLVHWGFTVGARAQRVSAIVMMALFLILAFMGVDSIITFAYAA